MLGRTEEWIVGHGRGWLLYLPSAKLFNRINNNNQSIIIPCTSCGLLPFKVLRVEEDGKSC